VTTAATRTLRLGTRRSALARAQSGAVARRLEELHPGLRVELIGIDTRGDRILDRPLSSIEGKEFFTAEIDAALLQGDVDLTVHSFKDLALERPAALTLGAVPRRENPRDIVLFAPDVRAQIARGAPLRVGSSSPRRGAFIPDFLRQALPGGAQVELCELRGNVDSRLRRLREPRGSARQLDAVVLAFAGLARLWRDESVGGRALLGELLAGLPRMIVPLTACPAAPAQGALAIECRSDDAATRALLAAIDDGATRHAVAAERQLLAARGGGCHQQFGATQLAVPGLGALLHLRAADASGAEPAQLRWTAETPLPERGPITGIWDGSQQGGNPTEPLPGVTAACAAALAQAPATFIAHRLALPDLTPEQAGVCAHVWVPGTGTWYALAARGVWVEGCAEGLGFETLQPLLAEPLLQLPAAAEWLVLTHAGAVAGWKAGRVLATYRHVETADADDNAAGGTPLAAASHLYWHSAAQFERWRALAPRNAQHACAYGKTAERLRAAGLATVTVFPSAREWREWLAT
jgi:hydroxymethylbilane synthase